jgi:hypothetical protein
MPNFTFRSIDIPAVAGTYTYIGVTGVDAAGEAVGYYGYVDGDGDGHYHGFVADNSSSGTTYDPAGSSNTDGMFITPSGEIYGDYIDYANRQHGFTNSNGSVTTVDFFPNQYTILSGVSDDGDMFGNFAGSFATVRGFVDINGVFSIVNVSGSAATSISGVNAAGEIVGTYSDKNFINHGFIIENGVTTTVDAPGAYSTTMVGVSASGLVVGNYQDLANHDHGFIDNNGIVTAFDIAGSAATTINAINQAGEFVGDYVDGGGNVHGFIDLNGIVTTIDIPGATETDVLGISAAGDVFGYYNEANGQHGFVSGLAPTVIEAAGSTSLAEVGDGFYLYTNGSGPSLKFAGAAVAASQFAPYVAIGAEQTAGGYEVAWKIPGTDQFSIWNTGSNGNYISYSVMSGASSALQSLEVSFHQDLNGDGVIGNLIEANGSTSLTEVGNNFYLYGSGTGPSLKYAGEAVVDGQFDPYAPVGAEQTAGGYEVAWKIPGTDQFSIWNTDSNGNYLSYSVMSGTSSALQSLEASFHQDLNGDGVIGNLIEGSGSTSLAEAGNNFYLYSGGTGLSLKFAGAAVADGQFAPYVPVGAEQTAGGYEVAWKIPGADQFSIWNTDSNGNYLAFSVMSGTSTALESLEPGFHQDLNGDGVIGTPASGASAAEANSTNDVIGRPAAEIVGGPGNDSFVFHPGLGAVIVNAGGTDTFELDGFSSVATNQQLTLLLHDAQTGQPQSMFESVNGGHDTVINLDSHDSITLLDVHIADLHASDFIMH